MTEVAGVVAGDRPSVTVLINGGQIAYTDVAEASAAVGRWWCSPEAVAPPTPLPGREPATVATTAPSRSRLPP